MENINSTDELFANIRKSIRLIYEYQKRMQGTMFRIKEYLGLHPDSRIEINKLYSLAPHRSKGDGEFQLYSSNWAWDYIFPMALEYNLGKKPNSAERFRLSIIQIADDGYYRALLNGANPNRLDSATYTIPDESNSWAVFVMEIKNAESPWARRWNRNKMEENLNKWMVSTEAIIDDTTHQGNHFIVMKFPMSEMLNEEGIRRVLLQVGCDVERISGYRIL